MGRVFDARHRREATPLKASSATSRTSARRAMRGVDLTAFAYTTPVRATARLTSLQTARSARGRDALGVRSRAADHAGFKGDRETLPSLERLAACLEGGRLRQFEAILRRTMSLFNQGTYWYRAIPNMREERLVPLMTEFGKLIADHAAFREIFGLL